MPREKADLSRGIKKGKQVMRVTCLPVVGKWILKLFEPFEAGTFQHLPVIGM